LVVVIDEMAGLAADLPEFLPALVSVAQRGRSLGLHLLLGTQRPAGVVNDDIRANTNLRVALRVQSAADSHDVIGEGGAASLSPHRPGRALVRWGPDAVVAVQVARASAADLSPDGPPVVVTVTGSPPVLRRRPTGPSPLERLAVAARDAAVTLGIPPA